MRNLIFPCLFLYTTSVYCDMPYYGMGALHQGMGTITSPLHVYLELQTLSQGLTANTQSRLFQFSSSLILLYIINEHAYHISDNMFT